MLCVHRTPKTTTDIHNGYCVSVSWISGNGRKGREETGSDTSGDKPLLVGKKQNYCEV